MTTNLGVSEHHHSQIVDFMRFARFQKAQRLKSISMAFDDTKDTRLTDSTFTVDEVTEILDSLLTVVRSDMEDELDYTTRTNVLLLRQMFQQAEQWHLKLNANVSEMENRELLEQIKEFEECEVSGRGEFQSTSLKPSLEPMNDSTGGAALLQMKISEMEQENEKLKGRMKQIESQAISAQTDKSTLEGKTRALESELEAARNRPTAPSATNDVDTDELKEKMAALQANLEQSGRANAEREKDIEDQMVQAKHELLKVQEMLEMTNKDLERKVMETGPYKNMKQMMQKKNDQIKDLRRRVAKYEHEDD